MQDAFGQPFFLTEHYQVPVRYREGVSKNQTNSGKTQRKPLSNITNKNLENDVNTIMESYSEEEIESVESPDFCFDEDLETNTSKTSEDTSMEIDETTEEVEEDNNNLADFVNSLHVSEKKYRPSCTYMQLQLDLNSNMRAILVDWLNEVAQEYKLRDETLYLSINLTDRFLCTCQIGRGKLQLVGITALFIAS
jgi:cyclin A